MSKNNDVMECRTAISERKTKIIGKTTYNVGVAYSDKGETLDNLLLQQIKERCQEI